MCCDCYPTKGGKHMIPEEVHGFVSNWSARARTSMFISNSPSLCFIPEITLFHVQGTPPGEESMGG